MRNLSALSAAMVLGLAVQPIAAFAAEPVRWVYCSYQRAGAAYATDLTEVFAVPDTGQHVYSSDWYKAMEAETNSRRSTNLSCPDDDTREKSESRRQETIDFYLGRGAGIGTLATPFVPKVRTSSPASSKVADKAAPMSRDSQAQEPVASGPTAAEFAAEKHRAVEERNRAAQEKYEAELAEQKRKVEEYEQAQADVARKKAEQAAAAQAALAAHDAELAVAAEAQRKHEADLAKYEQEVAAQKLRKDFDERHKLGQASTDTDANQCVTSPETQLNASFQGNTAASVMNGCGKPVDVRICLMTDKGWNCGVTYGLGSQQRWSHSSFNATGQLFSDARTSGSSRALASPN